MAVLKEVQISSDCSNICVSSVTVSIHSGDVRVDKPYRAVTTNSLVYGSYIVIGQRLSQHLYLVAQRISALDVIGRCDGI